MGLKKDISYHYKRGAKFVIIGSGSLYGVGHTPEAAWDEAIRCMGTESERDTYLPRAQCFHAAPNGPMINDWLTRSGTVATTREKDLSDVE
jgi:hypothetical protein